MKAQRVEHIFSQASANGEFAPPPSVPLPSVPGMPADFVAPEWDPHAAADDALRGAGEAGER